MQEWVKQKKEIYFLPSTFTFSQIKNSSKKFSFKFWGHFYPSFPENGFDLTSSFNSYLHL